MKDKILNLENELKLNKTSILKMQVEDQANSIEYRALLVQRSNLKDMLLDAYRAEMSVRVVDDFTGDVGTF